MRWDEEAYLETCCRSALHRLWLSGDGGRPAAEPAGAELPNFRQPLKDRPCLDRLAKRGLARQQGKRHFFITADGIRCHEHEVRGMRPRHPLFKRD